MSYIAEAVQRARQLGKTPEAALAWRELLLQTHVDEADYSDWARELAQIYAQRGRGLSAARIHEYLLNVDPAFQLYREHGTVRDQARVLRIGKRHKEAGGRFKEAGLYGHAARAFEDAGQFADALSLFEQLGRQKDATDEPYLRGLACLNAARMAAKLQQPEAVRGLVAVAMRLLEEEGDRRELVGDRDGAFRCYLSLIQCGKIEKSYEPVAEGFLNCIRILKNRGDRFLTMQFYYEFIALSEEFNELHAVAELEREAGEHAKRVGFIYADYFLVEAGHSWLKVAEQGQEHSQAPELIENALLAAVGCFNRVRDEAGVANCYERLAKLSLGEKKQNRYAALGQELRATAKPVSDAPVTFPEYFKKRAQGPDGDIWIVDLLDAESGSDIPDAIGRLIGAQSSVWEVQRRKALLIALLYDDHLAQGHSAETASPALVEKIGELGHQAAIRPLLAIYERGDDATKALVVQHASALKQKESFVIIERALQVEGPLKEAGTVALRRMTSPPSLDSLVRIFSAHEDAEVREACLRSIATIGTDEACEFLLDTIRSNAANMAVRARALLEAHAQERMISALERNRRQEPDASLRIFISRMLEKIRSQRLPATL